LVVLARRGGRIAAPAEFTKENVGSPFHLGSLLRVFGTERRPAAETLLIRLIGIDVDGTLVGSSGIVATAVWEAAERARVAGVRLTLCSGRPAFGVALDYARRLDEGGWHIFQNGASVVHLGTDESRSTPLSPGAAPALIAQARETEHVLELYSDSEYVVESTAKWAREHADLLGVPFEPRPLESLTKPIVRAQWLLSSEEAARVIASPPAELEVAQSSSPLMPDVQFVGLTRRGVSKGSAIRSVAAAYGIDLRDVMYIGDSGNDLSALRIVGHPIAMGNAAREVIAAAARTVGDVDAGGLAEALRLAVDAR
jgi:Cof subfamily protein (haloacid dehalogenase superfamily)